MIIDETAIVLRSKPYQERDRIVHLLTEHHGKITGIAKGAIHSRRFGGAFDLFNCVQLRYVDKPGNELVRIDEASIKREFSGIRQNLERISAAGYFADLCYRLTEERSPSRELFLLMAHYFFLLETASVSMELVRSFEVKLLDRLGYAPVMHQCVFCSESLENDLNQRNVQFYFVSIDIGGIICSQCQPPSSAKQLDRTTVLWLNVVRNTPIQQIPQLSFNIPSLLKSAGFLKEFLRYHCAGLDFYGFQSHDLLESLLKEIPHPISEELSPENLGARPNAQFTASNKSSAT